MDQSLTPVASGGVPGRRRLSHNPALDGIRGLAVLAVVLYHLDVLKGGWIGVEVFFVLSGYLITSLLVNEIDSTGRVDLLRFYQRRARRLIPGLVLLLVIVAVYARLVAEPTEYASIRREVAGALTYSSNWLTIFSNSGYWDHFASPSVLRHAWSLAVEEQYYIVYPVVAVVLLRRNIRTIAVPVALIAATGWQVWSVFHSSLDRFYLGTDTRSVGLLGGALVAIFAHRVHIRVATALLPVGLAFLIVGAVTLDGARLTTFRGPFQMVTLASMLIVLGAARPASRLLSSALSLSPLAAVGKWSYGIYLFHWPLILVLRRTWSLSLTTQTIIVLTVSVVAAWVSFTVIESPLRHNGTAAFARPRLTVAVAGLVGVLALVATISGARAPLDAADVSDRVAPTATDIEDARPLNQSGITPRPTDRPIRIMLVGDSVGASLEPPLQSLASGINAEVFSRAAPSCSYDRELTSSGDWQEDPSCIDIVNGWQSDVEQFRPDIVLFLYGSWSNWDYAGQARTQCDPVLADHVKDLYDLALTDLSSQGANVYFVAPPYWRRDGVDLEGDKAYDCLRENMRSFVATNADRAVYVDLHSLVCNGSNCEATAQGEPLRGDGLHFSGPGAVSAAIAVLSSAIEPVNGSWPDHPAIVRHR